ncbi:MULTISPECIES: sigma factor-like helix-turn-helix DNA-binding protein [Dehalobacter]|jgi:RNA polymerase sigma-70 factor (ECF subfamily)|uniref:Sigma-70 family RNA polymerase sigma factor n=2 Tax=Dehalobacter restrictus TaxID=55583 RepID=A0A857DFB5_9FIRM|nr:MULTISPECIES: sigma factor-like helix-turn-helix DNA-binding protein [Dehalobacter]AHF09059.1 RNA polymerase sigma24 factor [Dehalobacter restrictus DSM 9455]MCG1024926.1 sigma-70 family RNA polymerase sigma factor [Dehalobacter sp.]QGZ99586.1 sigma-70 family RNA polymerase sigma factor [Dehalobacter restrictus]
MARINLRNYYSVDIPDLFVEVTEEVADLLRQYNRKDHADYERRRIHKAYYSLDADDGIEKDVVLLVLSPEEVYERKLSNQELYAAINRLPEKQAKRLYAHFFLDMSIAQIARIERVGKSRVSHSINQALKNIEKFLISNL